LRDRLAESAESAGLVLSDKFFKTPDLFSSGFRPDERTANSVSSVKKPEMVGVNQGHGDMQQKKEQRQRNILEILKGQGNLTIKDFSKVMRDCSEKTIQRELIELVGKGIVRKEGERRWSRYSLSA